MKNKTKINTNTNFIGMRNSSKISLFGMLLIIILIPFLPILLNKIETHYLENKNKPPFSLTKFIREL